MRFQLQGDPYFGFTMWDNVLNKLVGDGKGNAWAETSYDEADKARDTMNERVGA